MIADRARVEEALCGEKTGCGSTVQSASCSEGWPPGHYMKHDHCSLVDLKSLIIIRPFNVTILIV